MSTQKNMIKEKPKEIKSWKLIQNYFNDVHVEGNIEKIDEYCAKKCLHLSSNDGYKQHIGTEKLKEFVHTMHESQFVDDRKVHLKLIAVSRDNEIGDTCNFELSYTGKDKDGKKNEIKSNSEWHINKSGKICVAKATIIKNEEKKGNGMLLGMLAITAGVGGYLLYKKYNLGDKIKKLVGVE